MQTHYYFSKLNKQQQAVYHAMLEGLQSLSASFSVPRLSDRELFEIHFLLRLDHPEIFYSEKISWRYYEHASSVEIVPEYLFDKKKIKTHQQAMAARVEKLVRPAAKLTEQEKIQYVHDFICQNVQYDKLKKQYSHEIIGPLGQGVGVCEGIAKTVKILCDALDLYCVIAISEANKEKEIKYRHAWNIIRTGGQYYHLDATFDNSLSKEDVLRYDYYLLDDSRIFRDHEPLVWPVPSCTDGDNFYYRQKKLSFTKTEDVRKRAAQAVKKNKPFIFHWRGGGLSKDVFQELMGIFEQEAAQKGKHSRVSVNVRQAVFYVTFQSEPVVQSVVQQKVDVDGEMVSDSSTEHLNDDLSANE
ncbi:MAG: peptidase [Peptococcaceae bacterium]|nr:peptidase [Peptococcaceae bacterium]